MSVSAAPWADFPKNGRSFIFCLISFVTCDHLTMNVVAKVGMGHHKDRDVSQAVQKMDNLVISVK